MQKFNQLHFSTLYGHIRAGFYNIFKEYKRHIMEVT